MRNWITYGWMTICVVGLSTCSSQEEPREPVNPQDVLDALGSRVTVVKKAEHPEAPEGMVLIPAGTYKMGSNDGFAHESPVHEVTLDAFYMDDHEVTNREFERFVAETGYVTEAEQWKWSIVFAPDESPGDRVPGAEWWKRADGATWRHPNGPETNIDGMEDYPVTQVSWTDSVAYAKWAGKRLPTEAEWEYAARGGHDSMPYAWGLDFAPSGKQMANTWNGHFPIEDSGEDGFDGLAPIKQYEPNGYGLYDIAGNVWEWVEDWYGANYYRNSPDKNPFGPKSGIEKVQRGGSFMCASNYCLGYRVSHRGKSGIDSGLPNSGFRCVQSVDARE
ncbi:MAG: formylglycine-generating enzyme family protein [Candidatus Hydrogenedentota bacterium]